ncbi:hypothetical protein EV189_3947 [Motilibacter rhizosphaerae]|uniref:Uncharacterized protein n=1 Tax=Motilibacter rhizosphaerae TaxID=598652 RepID=A0A4Q7N7F9_9ACTN|nr:hypothetical protein [Motilibacter rhizosphaerae]RZS77909.1 hypothetical protein EV189_3947 [Motilibacter rhizosphaerae]
MDGPQPVDALHLDAIRTAVAMLGRANESDWHAVHELWAATGDGEQLELVMTLAAAAVALLGAAHPEGHTQELIGQVALQLASRW